ncbi:TPR-like protein [Mycena rebaudengoi]|nr:TPR-like protein [Mycena rebaudengoi]
MFKPGDKLNPYDPASLELGADGVAQRIQNGTSPMTPHVAALLSDPAKMADFMEMMRRDREESERMGETLEQQILREKREWAEADAKSAKLKIEANEAFKAGDYKTAFVIYTACIQLSGHEPVYPLNRAAAALKLKLYESAVNDTSMAIEKGDFNTAKAYFRRGQARYFLGEWSNADSDYQNALALSPGDQSVLQAIEALKVLHRLGPDGQAAWLSKQGKLMPKDIFEAGELKRRVEELSGMRF